MPDAKWTKERVNIPECSVVCQKRIISGDIPLSRVPSSCLQSCPVFIFTFCAISRTAVRRRFHQLWLGRRVKIRIDATACLRWKPYEMDRRRTVWGEMVGLRREQSFHTEVWPTMGAVCLGFILLLRITTLPHYVTEILHCHWKR